MDRHFRLDGQNRLEGQFCDGGEYLAEKVRGHPEGVAVEGRERQHPARIPLELRLGARNQLPAIMSKFK